MTLEKLQERYNTLVSIMDDDRYAFVHNYTAEERRAIVREYYDIGSDIYAMKRNAEIIAYRKANNIKTSAPLYEYKTF